MNKIYEFTLHPSGYDPDKPRDIKYDISKGFMLLA